MKLTKQNRKRMVHHTIEKGITITLIAIALLGAILCLTTLMSCSSSDNEIDSEPGMTQTGTVNGSVKDENGNPYPSVRVVVSNGSDESARATGADGTYSINTKSIGTYEIEIELPLATEEVSGSPTSVNVQANQASSVDFVIQPQPVEAHLNFGSVQLLEEIVDENSNTPTASNEPLYAKNIFDDPIGLLTAIKAPDDHQVTLSEFKTAKGNLMVHCNGNTATVEIALEGMIPNGTYTFWLAYLNKTKKAGESIDFMNDFVNPTNPPIGSSSGTENIVIAGADGTINVTLEHSSCILTDEVALVIPILYHLNGKTFGGGHVPDAEEMVHMLAYFQ